MDNFVITIARQYGSGGRTVGEMLAKKLGIAARSTASRFTSFSPAKAPVRTIIIIWPKNTASTWRLRFSRGRIC